MKTNRSSSAGSTDGPPTSRSTLTGPALCEHSRMLSADCFGIALLTRPCSFVSALETSAGFLLRVAHLIQRNLGRAPSVSSQSRTKLTEKCAVK
jgi:hypothetical protein